MGFSSFSFQPQIEAGIRALGYTSPTPIQAAAIKPILDGRDVLGLAQTGTGKTAAFVLPILQRLMPGKRGTLRALIVAPTRELADQINASIGALGKQTGLRSTVVYGGVGFSPQADRLRAGVDILVACPGRLLDHMRQRTVHLDKIEVLVLDEADHMFDMGFLPNIRRIVAALPRQRQTLLFSATMPDDIKRLVGDVQRQPVTVQVDRSAPAKTVSHGLYPVPQHLKQDLLLDLLPTLTQAGPVLVFTRTKHRAKRLGEHLLRTGHRAASLQGNLSQNRRQEALGGFRNGRTEILVATDIAARGIDVAGIAHVVNFDIPDTTEAYTHRIGRTGRAACTGEALTFVAPEDESMVRSIERVLGERIARRRLDGFDYAKAAVEPNRRSDLASHRRGPPSRARASRPPRRQQRSEPLRA